MSITPAVPLPHNWYGVFSTTAGQDPVLLQELHRTPDLEAAITCARTAPAPPVEVLKCCHGTLRWVPWRE